jgi:hypothetical protein
MVVGFSDSLQAGVGPEGRNDAPIGEADAEIIRSVAGQAGGTDRLVLQGRTVKPHRVLQADQVLEAGSFYGQADQFTLLGFSVTHPHHQRGGAVVCLV